MQSKNLDFVTWTTWGPKQPCLRPWRIDWSCCCYWLAIIGLTALGATNDSHTNRTFVAVGVSIALGYPLQSLTEIIIGQPILWGYTYSKPDVPICTLPLAPNLCSVSSLDPKLGNNGHLWRRRFANAWINLKMFTASIHHVVPWEPRLRVVLGGKNCLCLGSDSGAIL